MTDEEKSLMEEIEDYEERKFLHEMQEHWTQEDFEYSRELTRKISTLKKKLTELQQEKIKKESEKFIKNE